jgi:hypothetical protein
MPRIPHSLLTQRLRSLERAGVVERRPLGRGSEYRLTRSGEELGAVVEALGAWGYRWAVADLAEDDLDPAALMWFWRFHLRREGTPGDRMVIEVEFTASRRSRSPTGRAHPSPPVSSGSASCRRARQPRRRSRRDLLSRAARSTEPFNDGRVTINERIEAGRGERWVLARVSRGPYWRGRSTVAGPRGSAQSSWLRELVSSLATTDDKPTVTLRTP